MSGNYRARWHNYRSRCIYHITLLKNPTMPSFSSLSGDWRIPVGNRGSSYIASSPLGRSVKAALREISQIHPALKLYSYALMPDHLHMLISVEQDLDEIVGRKIGLFKDRVNKHAQTIGVFEKGFNDQILTTTRKLQVIYNYLRSNPYRLAIRKANPDFFQRKNLLNIAGITCQAFGNIQLIDNPFKDQVVVHRADGEETFSQKKDAWLYTAANGGVLISPFISKREKEIRQEAEAEGGRFILITNQPFGEREKPTGRDFELCACGRMLIIAPQSPLDFSRAACLQMNRIAEQIAQI